MTRPTSALTTKYYVSLERVSLGLSLTRIILGFLLIAIPRTLMKFINVKDNQTAASIITSRAAGIRDVAMGIGTIAAKSSSEKKLWLRLGALCDATDAAAAMSRDPGLRFWFRALVPYIAFTTALVELVLSLLITDSSTDEDPFI
jgi:hypothetical protein